MARRLPGDLHRSPRRFSYETGVIPARSNEHFPLPCGKALHLPLEARDQQGFPELISGKAAAQGRRRKSFHGADMSMIKRDRHASKTSASVSVVGLGCWAPSQSKESIKALGHPAHPQSSCPSTQDPLLNKVMDKECPSATQCSESTAVKKVHTELHPLGPSSEAVDKSGFLKKCVKKKSSEPDSPTVFLCSFPRNVKLDTFPKSIANYSSPVDAYEKPAQHCKKVQNSTNNKSRLLRQQGVKDVQIAIHRLSTKLKHLDLENVLVSEASPELAPDELSKDIVEATACEDGREESGKAHLERRCTSQQEEKPLLSADFAQMGGGTVRGSHQWRQKIRHHASSKQRRGHTLLRPHLEGTIEHAEWDRPSDATIHIYPAKEHKQAPQDQKATGVCRNTEEQPNNCCADGSSIKLEIISYPNKEVTIKDSSASVQLLNIAERVHISGASQSNSRPDVEGGSFPGDHNVVDAGSNAAGSPSFSELLLSDVGSPSSENSSHLSEVLQNYSGNQTHREDKSENSLLKGLGGQQAGQGRDQLSQTLHSHEQKAGCNDDEHIVCSFSGYCTDSSGGFSSSNDCNTAMLSRDQQDNASQKRAVDIDSNLVLARFGKLLLSSIPCEGMQMVASEPLFHETMKVARAFLRLLSFSVIESGKAFIFQEYSDHQSDGETSPIRISALPNARFAHQQHIKYGVQAFINELIFDQFDKPSYRCDNRNANWCVLLVEFQRLAMVAPVDAINRMSENYDKWFHSFCSEKLQLMEEKMPWLIGWPDYLLQAFLDAMKYVWQAHLLAQASLDTISLFRVNECSQFNSSFMEVVDPDHDAAQFISKVQFMLSPGFKLQGRIVKSEVYLIPKTQIAGGSKLWPCH